MQTNSKIGIGVTWTTGIFLWPISKLRYSCPLLQDKKKHCISVNEQLLTMLQGKKCKEVIDDLCNEIWPMILPYVLRVTKRNEWGVNLKQITVRNRASNHVIKMYITQHKIRHYTTEPKNLLSVHPGLTQILLSVWTGLTQSIISPAPTVRCFVVYPSQTPCFHSVPLVRQPVSWNTTPAAPASGHPQWSPTAPAALARNIGRQIQTRIAYLHSSLPQARHCSRAVLMVGQCGLQRRWVLAYKRRCGQCGRRGRLLMCDCHQSYSRIHSRGRIRA